MDATALAAAMQFTLANETKSPRDGRAFQQQNFGKEPHSEPVGPLFDRGGVCGLVVRNGYVIAEWGDVARQDMCNSVTKTFLTTEMEQKESPFRSVPVPPNFGAKYKSS